VGRLASKSLGAGFGAERRQLLRISRAQCDLQTLGSEQPRQRRAQPASGTDDQRSFIARLRHVGLPRRVISGRLSDTLALATLSRSLPCPPRQPGEGWGRGALSRARECGDNTVQGAQLLLGALRALKEAAQIAHHARAALPIAQKAVA